MPWKHRAGYTRAREAGNAFLSEWPLIYYVNTVQREEGAGQEDSKCELLDNENYDLESQNAEVWDTAVIILEIDECVKLQGQVMKHLRVVLNRTFAFILQTTGIHETVNRGMMTIF